MTPACVPRGRLRLLEGGGAGSREVAGTQEPVPGRDTSSGLGIVELIGTPLQMLLFLDGHI